ncbi:hypothetical protein QIS74_01035 [Colletotrichum tabaci]|uniref:Uncharacterized protein n=1 Tax=Colletotrichum tabaci TaxID=1209068 RepID=A0AAV9TVL7_9PEZI
MTNLRDKGPGSGLDPVVVVDFGLGIFSEADSQFRFNSDGIFTPRETAVLVRCSLVDVVHGQATPDDDTPCTLLVFDFQLDRVKASRTIHQAIISLVLPEGVRIRKGGLGPAGKVSFDPQSQSVSSSTEASLSAGFSHGGTLEGGVTRGESVSMDTTHYATVMGWTTRHPKARPHDPRPHNCARWALHENQARRDGVPPHFRAAVLLERGRGADADADFNVEVDVSAKVDLKTAVEDFTLLLGEAPRGCLPIRPRDPGTHNLREYDAARLSNQVGDLWRLSSGALETAQFSRDFV